MSDDLISRQAAIDAVLADVDDESRPITEVRYWNMGLTRASEILKGVPSAQPGRRFDEWCTDCKEYDHERHCCPRWNRVIRTILQEVQPEVIRCKDCKYHPNNPRPYADDDPIETFIHCQFMEASDFCSKGKRMEVEE